MEAADDACVTCGDPVGEEEEEGEAGSPRVCLLCLGAACFQGWGEPAPHTPRRAERVASLDTTSTCASP